MKKVFTFIALVSFMASVSGQAILKENFEGYANNADLEVAYDASGNSYNYATDWYPCFKAADRTGVSSVVMVGALTYADYISSGIGKSVVFSADALANRISTRRVLLDGGLTNKLYVSFLVNITGAQTSIRDFFTFEGSTTSSFTRGRVFAEIDVVEGVEELKFGVSKNSSSSSVVTINPTIYAPNTTYLMVVVYEVLEGDNNDQISIYVNPDMSGNEAANSSLKVTSSNEDNIANSDYSSTAKIGINIRQRGVGAKIGGIRVSNDWYGLWTDTPTSIANNKIKDLNAWVNGKNLTLNNGQPGSLSVYDMTGREQMNVSVDGNETLTLNLPNAMYVVKYIGGDGTVQTAKVILR